ncbi:MAG: hypothetical protein ACLQVL_26955 [Terriglobia bacterium]
MDTTEQYREVFDAGEALSSVGGDAEYLTEVVGLMQAAWPTLLADIRKGMARGDLRAVEMTARLARAAAQNVAAKRAYASAQRLATMAGQGDLPAAQGAIASLEREVAILQFRLAALGPDDSCSRPRFSFPPR